MPWLNASSQVVLIAGSERLPESLFPVGLPDDAEFVAFGIRHDVPVESILVHLPAELSCAKREQPIAFFLEVIDEQIEMHPVLALLWFRNTLQEQLREFGTRRHQREIRLLEV